MINFKVWLTALLVTSGVWVAFDNGAKAQSGGSITIKNGSLIQNGTIPNDSTTNAVIRTNNNNTSANSTNSNSNGGNISIEAKVITPIKITSIPEPSVLVGILAVAGGAVVSRLKHKQK